MKSKCTYCNRVSKMLLRAQLCTARAVMKWLYASYFRNSTGLSTRDVERPASGLGKSHLLIHISETSEERADPSCFRPLPSQAIPEAPGLYPGPSRFFLMHVNNFQTKDRDSPGTLTMTSEIGATLISNHHAQACTRLCSLPLNSNDNCTAFEFDVLLPSLVSI